MNYPLLTILITKIYMIYNSNFIYTWQLLDQVRDRFTWPQLEELHNQSDPGTGKILKPLMLPVNLVSSQCTGIRISEANTACSKHQNTWGRGIQL